jgi:hypothetical protein
MDLGTYDHYGYAAVALLGTFAAAAATLWVTLASRFAAPLRSYRGIVPPFLNVIGLLFGLTLAFLANDTWNAHDRAIGAVFQEADGLRSMMALARHLPPDLRAKIDGAVKDYARLTVEDEWPQLARRQSSRQAAEQLDTILGVLSGADVVKSLSPAVHSVMLHEAIRVRTTRDLRISLSQTHVNPLKWLGMAFLGFLTIISIAMVHVDQTRAEILAVMLFAAAAAPTAAIVLVQGNPFQQPTAVTSAPIQSLLSP